MATVSLIGCLGEQVDEMPEQSLRLDNGKWMLRAKRQLRQTLVLDAKDPPGKWVCLRRKSF